MNDDPHRGQPVRIAGDPDDARTVMVFAHGRFAGADDGIAIARAAAVPGTAIIAPQAAGNSWWPDSFLAPHGVNEPYITSAVGVVTAIVDDLAARGVAAERVVLGGFSQGACLALEAAARMARPFRAVVALSGGLVGTGDADGAPDPALYGRADKTFRYDGRLDGVPILIGCHERDPHIPLARVERSAQVLEAMGAVVETIVIPGEGHGIVDTEIAWLRGQLEKA